MLLQLLSFLLFLNILFANGLYLILYLAVFENNFFYLYYLAQFRSRYGEVLSKKGTLSFLENPSKKVLYLNL